MKNKSLLLIILSVFLLVLTSCKSNDNITVFSGGETDYSIIIAEGASDEALELAEALSDLSGASPEILTDAAKETDLEILIADTSRAETAKYVEKIQDLATVSAFHFIVAESDGKLIILSDADIGYIYALNYIKATYINGGTFSIPSETYDFKQVMWDDYYSSDLYFDRLTAAEDKDVYEDEKEQLKNEMNRYENNNGDTMMTVEEAIEQYRNLAASFTTSDFGEYTAETFTSANTYRKPTVYPGETHPRIYFTENSIDKVRENLTASENANAYKKYIALSDVSCDGKFKTVSGNMTNNYDSELVAKIEAKAFRYAMTGDKIYGYEAIYAVKNAILTIDVPHTVGDWCRSYGHLMDVAAYVYDWCYDLLTEEDKTQLINGVVNLLGTHLEIVCYVSSTNKVPTGQGTIYGHGAESQILVDYLSFAIACYDEAPEIYELVAGRVLNDYTEAQNYLFQSGSHWEGTFYGSYRTAATILSNTIINKMTDGAVSPFSDKLEDAAITATYYLRPDGQPFRIGDMNENTLSYPLTRMSIVAFYAGNLYGNSYLKNFAYENLQSYSYFSNGTSGLSAVQLLALNDTSVSHVYTGTAPLTRTTTYPNTGLFAKSTNDDENAFSIFMTMPENYVASHAHMECGSFQIFYKGILASDSGAYTSWGGAHHMGYNMQTISSNSLLIYNPNLAGTANSYRPNMIYSGGQTVALSGELPKTLSELLAHDRLGQCTSLGVANVEKDGVYLYSYMGGDMTKAYDAVTVNEVTRYMFAVATGNEECPLVFMTYDRITSDDASYKKSALIHVQEEPTITSDGFAIVTNTKNGNSGKMIVQSVGDATTYTPVGGEGMDCYVDGKNLPTNINLIDNSIAEYGWGRIEISPANADLTNRMLTVMYVTDATNSKAPVKATNIGSEDLAGAMIFGKAVLFSKNEKLLDKEATFTIDSGADCYVAGVSAGTWNVMNGETVILSVTVEEGVNLLTFSAGAGTYTIKPAN